MNADVFDFTHPSTPDDIHANPLGLAQAERAPPTVLDPSDALNVLRPGSCEEFFIHGPAKSWAARKQVPGENKGLMGGRAWEVSSPPRFIFFIRVHPRSSAVVALAGLRRVVHAGTL
jgi:hypothetical protein